VETARDGQEALEKLRATPGCRLVLSDIEMPRLNGFELLSQMRSDPRLAQIPLVYLTSRSGEKHRSLALQLGAVGFLNKPYLESELQQVVERVLA
jgi:chemotaxis family two-component system sensor histidine kinase/response regulator PixL